MKQQRVIAIAAFSLLTAGTHAAQDGARQIWDSGFRQKRPAPAVSSPPAPEQPAAAVQESGRSEVPGVRVDYRADGDRPTTVSSTSRVIGVTIWRLHAADSASAPGARLLVQERPGVAQEFVALRVATDEPLREGDRIRIGLEIPSPGFLYVIDREKRADGTTGTPHLIFPARNLRRGDNRVEAGRLIEIPSQADPVPALVVTPASRDQVGEELLLFVAARAVSELEAGERERPLAPELVRSLEERFAVDAQRLRKIGAHAERYWTAAERDASISTRLLTQADPMPEVLYQANAKTAEGVIVRIPLPVGAPR